MGSYRLVRKIACGGMAEVYLAKAVGAQGFEKPVAVKRVLPHIAQEPRFLELFLREARLTCALQHANVVQVFDLGLSAGQPYMVLEFVDGENLRTLLKAAKKQERPFPLKEALFIVQQVAEGLAYAHERCDAQGEPLYVIHRDINPANVMVSSSGEVKLADFGIAKATDFNTETQVGVVKGKAGYLAPEQVAGRMADQRSDLFLMGLLLFELLAGKPLFDGANFFQSLQDLRAFDPSKLPPLPGAPESILRLLARALEPRPEARFQRARELADALQGFLFEERMRVGPSDVAALFARVLPERTSPLAGLHEAKGEDIRLDTPVTPAAVVRPAPSTQAVSSGTSAAARPPTLLPRAVVERVRAPDTATPSSARALPPGVARGKGAKQKLGELLVARGLVSVTHIRGALEQQKRRGGRLGELLVAQGMLGEDDLVRCLGEQLGLPFATVEQLRSIPRPGKEVLALVPFEKAKRHGAVPLWVHRREVYVALQDPLDLARLDELKFIAGMAVRGVLVGETGLRQTLRRFYLGEEPIEAAWVDEDFSEEAVPLASGTLLEEGMTHAGEQSFSEDALTGVTQKPPVLSPLPWREVLVVSDGREQREAAVRLLSRSGVKATAVGPSDAVGQLARGVFQLVLLERESGGALLPALRQAAPRVPVRLVSSFAEALAGEGGPAEEAARLATQVLEGALGMLGGAGTQGAALGRLAGRVARRLGASSGEAEQAAVAASALVLASRAEGAERYSPPSAPALRALLGAECAELEDVVVSCCGNASSAPRTTRAAAVACASHLLVAAGTVTPTKDVAAQALRVLRQEAVLPREGVEALAAALAMGGATTTAGARVVVVMERSTNAAALQARLLTEGLQVLLAESAAAAHETLARGAEALVVSTGLPGLDALSLTRQVRARSALPVFLVTPREDAAACAAGLQAGADDVVSRALPAEVLATKLRRALTQRGS
ncbi:MAG: protein kinase [Myxococcaceae bacterium]|nr:protein kinase [Myxococcaceae bacterium]MCI0672344.1 protein kinase [Myxococcaceae bacterium]